MKKSILFLAILVVGCSNPDKIFKESIVNYLTKRSGGFDPKYRSEEFEIIEKITAKQISDSLFSFINATTLELDSIFSDITKGELIELRNQELDLRRNQNYYEFAFNECKTEWCLSLKKQVEKTDEIIAIYPNVDKLDLYENVCWYKIRFWEYHQVDKYKELFEGIQSTISILKENKIVADSLSKLEPNKIIKYKAANKFKVFNPIVKLDQTIQSIFEFDENYNVINQIDINN